LPPYDAGTRYQALVATTRSLYRERNVDYHGQLQDYSTSGDYLNYGVLVNHRRDTSLQWDARGIPLVQYGSNYFYNPVTIAQYALSLHGKYLAGSVTAAEFLNVADFLTEIEGANGGFAFPFPYTHYREQEELAVGWSSGMAQGVALSVFARAYALTGAPEYLDAGQRDLAFLLTNETSGGSRTTLSDLDPALAGFLTLEEYPTDPSSFTLNGFGFALLGLYDWWHASPPDDAFTALAHTAFECGMATLDYVLPFYDVGGFSAYDLGHIVPGGTPNLQMDYHAIHISLLHALNSVSPDAQLQLFEARWRADVD
jgi:hypothetical protein